MARRLVLLLLPFIALSLTAKADILSVRQNIGAPTDPDHVEVTAFLAENETDRLKVVETLENILLSDRVDNPSLMTGFEEVLSDLGRSPSSVEDPVSLSIEKIAGDNPIARRKLGNETLAILKSRFGSWFDKNYKITFALTRGFLNGGVTTYSLMVARDVPFPIALAAGTITGAMSGSVQYWNTIFQRYLTKTIPEKYIPGELLRAGVKRVEPFFRWYILEVGFVGILQLTMEALGYGPPGTIAHIIQTNLLTSVATVGAQGFWDVAVSKATRTELAKATLLRRKNRVQLRADLITLALSALSVTAMVGRLEHLPIANYIFGTMGVTGLVYFVKVWHSEWKCKQSLLKVPPPRKDEETTIEVTIPDTVSLRKMRIGFDSVPVWV